MDRYSYRNRSHLADLEMNGCHETWRPLLNSMYHFSYVWGIAFAMGFGGCLILRWLDKKYGCVQCSQSSSPSVVGVGRDGLRLIVRLFWGARTDYAREG